LNQPIPHIFVIWHPACSIGETLARKIYSWHRPGHGVGPEVSFRCLPAPDADPGGLPLPLPGMFGSTEAPGSTRSNLQVAVILINDQMVADPQWRNWLAALARKPAANEPLRVCLPVALDSTAYNVPAPMRDLNFLRPTGFPIPPGTDPTHGTAVDIVVRSLLKQLTEALCHLLFAPLDQLAKATVPVTAVGQSKISIFLSHAKADGVTPARRLRDYIYSQTQLAAFYDENDIPFGSAFAPVLLSSLQATGTTAMIAVHSALYATRSWCRRELSMFRTPVQVLGTPPNGPQLWRLNPVVVVNALEAGTESAGIPEMGRTPQIRWSDDIKEQPEAIVTTALRDVMLSSVHTALGAAIAGDQNDIVINWLPDQVTLPKIPAIRDRKPGLRVHYPGRGLSSLDLETLDEQYGNVTFHSFDQVAS
jgi:hypothetical protein